MSPVIPCVHTDRNAASTPIRNTVDGSNVASVRKPAVPYENFTPVNKHPTYSEVYLMKHHHQRVTPCRLFFDLFVTCNKALTS